MKLLFVKYPLNFTLLIPPLTLLEKLEDYDHAQGAQRLGDALSDLDEITSRAHFIIGLRWGARIALAITRDDPDIFSLSK